MPESMGDPQRKSLALPVVLIAIGWVFIYALMVAPNDLLLLTALGIGGAVSTCAGVLIGWGRTAARG